MRLLIPTFSIQEQPGQLADLAAYYGIPLVTPSTLLTTGIKEQTRLGNRAKSYLQRGELIPDVLMLELIKERITELEPHQGWILAGYPQNINQANLLDSILSELGQPYDLVICLKSVSKILKNQLSGNKTSTPDKHKVHSAYQPETQGLKVPLLRFYQQFNFLVTISNDMSLKTIDHFLQASLVKLAHA